MERKRTLYPCLDFDDDEPYDDDGTQGEFMIDDDSLRI